MEQKLKRGKGRPKGTPVSDELKLAVSLRMKGVEKTKEHKIKTSIALRGKEKSESHKKAMSNTRKGKLLGPQLPIWINGIYYRNKKCAMNELGINWYQLQKVLNNL